MPHVHQQMADQSHLLEMRSLPVCEWQAECPVRSKMSPLIPLFFFCFFLMLHQHKVNCYIKYCFALHFFFSKMPRLRVVWQLYLWINLFYNQVLTAVCFTSGTLYMGEKKPSNQWEKWGKKPCYIRVFFVFFFFFKEQLMYMPIGHWFYFTEWFKNNEPKSSWVCFKKLAKLSFISKLSFVLFFEILRSMLVETGSLVCLIWQVFRPGCQKVIYDVSVCLYW